METSITTIPNIKIKTIKAMVEKIEKIVGENGELSFEFILASLFPTCWNNIQKELAHQYTLGYIQGQKNATPISTSIVCEDDDSDCYCE